MLFTPLKRGFTLIEISIVLVIIALVAGGVVVGRELVVLGQARKVITQMEQLQLAINAFRLKYECKPGDCGYASRLNLGSNGNGNGLNGGSAGQSSTAMASICLFGLYQSAGDCMTNVPGSPVYSMQRSYGEHQWFWAHLSASGMIKEPIINNTQQAGVDIATAYPRDALGREYIHVAGWNGKFYVRTGLASVSAAHGITEYGRGTMDAGLMQAIYGKFNESIIIGTTASLGNHPTALVQGQRIVPVGTWGTAYYQDPTGSAFQRPACVVAAANGAYRFNENNGRCDMLWELDY